MSKINRLMLAGFACGLVTVAGADTLQMGTGENTALFEQAGEPSRGMTQARVERDFGTPSSKGSAVGEPPISRWEYPGFVVFFEYDRVIHAVTKR
jgi:hypothetical protein